MTGQSINGTTVNGAIRPQRVPVLGDWQPIHLGGMPAADQPMPAPEQIVETAPPVTEPEPRIDHVALAEADRIRKLADAEAEARRIEAEGKAEAERIRAADDAEKLRLENERKRMRLEKDQAAHELDLAEKAAKKATADAARERAAKAAEDEDEQERARTAEQERSQKWWKWGARGIYAVGLAIAAPVQFLDFWDPAHPFMVVAPALLEGFALVLAFGAAWAVAHRRDVAPYRVGIMLGALIAAGVNLRGGMTNPVVGLNAGIIGAVASLGGPIVLMAYEHGMAQKADGILSWRDRRAETKRREAEEAARAKARAERKAAEEKAAADKKAREDAAEAEQKRKDSDRQNGHDDVWKVAEALRSARGLPVVSDALWGEAWLLVTGSTKVGIRPEIEAASRTARQLMKDAVDNGYAQVESHRPPVTKRDSNAPDGRRFNGGTPPRRTPGDSQPTSPIARTQARLERTASTQRDATREDS